jgi:hypothetical protein
MDPDAALRTARDSGGYCLDNDPDNDRDVWIDNARDALEHYAALDDWLTRPVPYPRRGEAPTPPHPRLTHHTPGAPGSADRHTTPRTSRAHHTEGHHDHHTHHHTRAGRV